MIKMIKSKLSVKIFIITVLLLVICCSLTYLFIALFVPAVYSSDIKDIENLAVELSEISEYSAEEDVPYFFEDFFEDVDRMLAEEYDGAFTVHLFNEDGVEVSFPRLRPLSGDKRISDYSNVPTSSSFHVRFPDNDEIYTAFFSNNSQMVNQVVEALRSILPILIATVLLLSLAGASLYSWYITSPIIKISKASTRMAELDLDWKYSDRRSDEIGILSNNLNELAAKLSSTLLTLQSTNVKLQADIENERKLESQRIEFFSAISHELKTPITIIKGQLQGMLSSVGRYKDRDLYLAQSMKTVNVLESMVQELLTLSKLETPGYIFSKTEIDISLLLNERLNFFEDMLMQKDMTLEKELPSSLVVQGDAQLLQKAVDNLIGNAVAYSPAGSIIRAHVWKEGERVALSLENTGIHIPDTEIPKLFEAFYRVEQSRNRETGGSGLGLYIVKTILDLHSAVYSISNTDSGVVFNIRF